MGSTDHPTVPKIILLAVALAGDIQSDKMAELEDMLFTAKQGFNSARKHKARLNSRASKSHIKQLEKIAQTANRLKIELGTMENPQDGNYALFEVRQDIREYFSRPYLPDDVVEIKEYPMTITTLGHDPEERYMAKIWFSDGSTEQVRGRTKLAEQYPGVAEYLSAKARFPEIVRGVGQLKKATEAAIEGVLPEKRKKLYGNRSEPELYLVAYAILDFWSKHLNREMSIKESPNQNSDLCGFAQEIFYFVEHGELPTDRQLRNCDALKKIFLTAKQHLQEDREYFL